MGLFNKKAKEPTSYQDTVDYLRDLSQQDYTKILKVVNIYREADKSVKKVLNIKDSWSETWVKDEPEFADQLLPMPDEPQEKPAPKRKKAKK